MAWWEDRGLTLEDLARDRSLSNGITQEQAQELGDELQRLHREDPLRWLQLDSIREGINDWIS